MLDYPTVICEINSLSGKVYKVRSFLRGAKLIEVNERIVENIQLLIDKPESDGFLGIVMLKQLGDSSDPNSYKNKD